MNWKKGLGLYLFEFNAKIGTTAYHLKRAKQHALYLLMISTVCASKLIHGFMLLFFCRISQKSAIPH